MDNLIGLVNRLQQACTVLGDYGVSSAEDALPTLWEQLPSVAVVGGQSSGKSSVLESIVGKDFLPRGSGIVTRRPLVLQLHKVDSAAEYAEFLHHPGKKYTDWAAVRKEVADETDRITGKTKMISPVPIHLSIYSPNVVNLTLVDLPGLTKIAVEGQSETIVRDIEEMVRQYVEKPNCIILAVSPANQDIATSDAMRMAREVDPEGERTWGVLTKLDLMDKGTNALDVLEGRSYKLKYPWVGVVNRSQADINRNVDMLASRRKEREYFQTSADYSHLANRMGTEYLAKMLSKHLEQVIRSKIPGIQSLINNNIDDLEKEMNALGRPIGGEAGAQLYTVLEMCRAFDKIFKEHLDGGRPGGDRINAVFETKLPAALNKLPFDKHLSIQNVRRIVAEADGYQPHLIAPEGGYRRLIESALLMFKGPAEAVVDEVHFILRDLVRISVGETTELLRFPSLQAELSAAATQSLESFRENSRKLTVRLVEMETSYLTVEFFRRLPGLENLEDGMEVKQGKDGKKGGGSGGSSKIKALKGSGDKLPTGADRYQEMHFRRIGSNVSTYVGMVMECLQNSIPKAVVHSQVREAKRRLLDRFYAMVGREDGKALAKLLDEDPDVMARRQAAWKRLELLRKARNEIDSVGWAQALDRSLASPAWTDRDAVAAAVRRHLVTDCEEQNVSTGPGPNGNILGESNKGNVLPGSNTAGAGDDAAGKPARRAPFSEKVVEARTRELIDVLDSLRTAGEANLESLALSNESIREDGVDCGDDRQWRLKEEGKEHRVLYRKGPEGTPLHEICLEGIINGPLDTLLAVVWEVPFFKDWWPQFSVPPFKVLESKFAHRIAPGLELSYLQFRSPWPFATRELLFFAFMVHDTATGLFVASVLSPPDDISHMDPETAALHPSAIPSVAPGCVRMTVGGGFAGQDLGGGHCYFRGACTLDMKFDLMPPWLINFVARQLAGSGYHLLCHEVDTNVKATAATAAAGVKSLKCDKKNGRGAFQQLLASDPVYVGLRKAMEEYRRGKEEEEEGRRREGSEEEGRSLRKLGEKVEEEVERLVSSLSKRESTLGPEEAEKALLQLEAAAASALRYPVLFFRTSAFGSAWRSGSWRGHGEPASGVLLCTLGAASKHPNRYWQHQQQQLWCHC
ncbi:unnamed protein product [Closterium sp. Naga37s-1]|nr:unnamed protein product [Closterium sp. Naga37s-1]